MNDQDKQLYNEENLSLQKEMLAEIKQLRNNPIIMNVPARVSGTGKKSSSKLVEKFQASVDRIVEAVQANNSDKILNEIEKLNDELSRIRILNEQQQNKTDEISVKNIQDAQTKEVRITNLSPLEDAITKLIDNIKQLEPSVTVEKQDVKFPNRAKDYVSVRLTNGKEFYEALAMAASGGGR